MLKLIPILLFTARVAIAQVQQVNPLMQLSKEDLQKRRDLIIQDSEFERNEEGRHTNIHENCLLVNGVPFEVGLLNTHSWGLVSLVRGKPGTAQQETIPFRAYVRRKGFIVPNPFLPGPTYQVSMSAVLAVAQPGDVLIVDPLRPEDYKAKRVLKLID